ncbi:hypothetical protein [Streptomyces sp. MJM1172]|uniref:hypothetical protein n=1 Tax=Streptomyces sp. MJM1172 TaxID=1703926 RepID=UPI000938949A|nr:hypothetical protein [Streptomyces sp. MJM1172]OKI46084.1 hypothetical protein AMK15_35900 [Streptomyces sp. MJM1172]
MTTADGQAGKVEGVHPADRAREVALVRGEVGQGAGEQRGEVGPDVRGRWGAAGSAELQEAQDGKVEVEVQAVGAFGYHRAQVGVDEGLAVAGQTPGEVVGAVLRGEVAFTDRSTDRDVRYLR